MPKRIHILPDEVKHKIAAGEVVEGPFSIVKELLENSLDAGAKNIVVEIEQAGTKKILVQDDGEGIYCEDIPFVTCEHATSKIQKIEDISTITTYGFRGEALSSIASIAEITLFSRRRDENIGAKLVSKNGKTEITEYMGQFGTTVIVENLFYNIPARKKFLKSQVQELRAIKDVFNKIALSRPEVMFKLNVEGKTSALLVHAKSFVERIQQIFGEDVGEHLIESHLKDLRASIYALLSNKSLHRPNRSMQFLFVNGRPVEYKALGFLLSNAYGSFLQSGQHPAAFIFIDIDPSLVDVNVHPAKKEVRFFDQNYINGLITNVIRKALDRDQKIQRNFIQRNDEILHKSLPVVEQNQPKTGEIFFGEASRLPVVLSSAVSEEQTPYVADIVSELDVKILFDTYIAVFDEDGIVLIDFHAAHERLIYDEISQKNKTVESQTLLFPQLLDLSTTESEIVLALKDLLEILGFEIDEIGKHSIVVRKVPAVVGSLQLNSFFQDIAHECDPKARYDELKEKIFEKIACHAARRAGERLSLSDARMIAKGILSNNHALRCPHGRPIVHRIGKKEIDNMFKRR